MPIGVTESTFLVVTSMVMSSFVIVNAYLQKQQFYPSVVYITKSNASMAIIYIQGLVFVLLLGKLIRKIFFGQLRTAEMENLIERSWYAVTETCLAFTVFRDDLSPKFVALFTLLLFLKCFHWLAEDRVDYMERSPNISLLFHVRVVSLLTILGLLDIIFVYMAYHSTLTRGASVQLVFGFEYAILFAIILNISMKYVLHFFDLYNENPWEDKAIYLLYTELIMGFLKICLYMIFILIMMKIHTFPLFAIRPMYLTMRGFKKALNDVIMSRRAIRNMNTLYPDATAQDIENSDNVCIICRENMIGNGSCKKLPCNHIFHVSCLRSWFQRQQTCPTCRMDVLRVSSQAANGTAGAANNVPNQANAPAAGANDPNANANDNVNAFMPRVPPVGPFAINMQMFERFQQFFQHNINRGHGQGQAQPQPQTQSTNNNNASSSSNTSAGSTNTPFPPPPLANAAIPPNIFPFLQSPPFPIPQIPTEVLLQGFTDQELRLLEGSERRNLEARIKCLLDVKTLVNAASFRLQQYNNVLLNTTSTSTVGTQTDIIPPPEPAPSTTWQNNSADGISSQTAFHPSTSTATTNISVNNSGDQFDDKELIRQRRLQHFKQTTSENGENSDTHSAVQEDAVNNVN